MKDSGKILISVRDNENDFLQKLLYSLQENERDKSTTERLKLKALKPKELHLSLNYLIFENNFRLDKNQRITRIIIP